MSIKTHAHWWIGECEGLSKSEALAEGTEGKHQLATLKNKKNLRFKTVF